MEIGVLTIQLFCRKLFYLLLCQSLLFCYPFLILCGPVSCTIIPVSPLLNFYFFFLLWKIDSFLTEYILIWFSLPVTPLSSFPSPVWSRSLEKDSLLKDKIKCNQGKYNKKKTKTFTLDLDKTNKQKKKKNSGEDTRRHKGLNCLHTQESLKH